MNGSFLTAKKALFGKLFQSWGVEEVKSQKLISISISQKSTVSFLAVCQVIPVEFENWKVCSLSE